MMTDFYRPLHARRSVPVRPPKLISAGAFCISGKTPEDENKLRELIRASHRICDPDVQEDLSGNFSFELFTSQREIIDHHKKITVCMLQKHTSFFFITFFADSISSTQRFWGAIPQELIGQFSWASFKTHIRVEAAITNKDDYSDGIEDVFNSGVDTEKYEIRDIYTDLFCSKVSDGKAVVWTPFKQFSDGFNRILIRDIDLRPPRLGRLVRRLEEIDLYMTLGAGVFNEAQQQLINFMKYEERLKDVLKSQTKNLAHAGPSATNRELYDVLDEIAIQVASDISDTRSKFQAAIAYSDLVWRRIHELREDRVEGWTRLGFFLERSFRPCINTCESALKYQIAISQNVQQTATMLNAKINLDLIEKQKTSDEEQRDFRSLVELIALVPIVYYATYIIYSIIYTDIEKGKLVWLISPIVILAALLPFLVLPRARKFARRLTGKFFEAYQKSL